MTPTGPATPEAISAEIAHHLRYTLAKDRFSAVDRDRYIALAMTVRDRLVDRWVRTAQTYYEQDAKRVYYLSLEYLLGRLLNNNTINLDLDGVTNKALTELGLDFQELSDMERDAGLGNGGLGRLAACFLDSMATLGIPGYGYGIRYEYGIFRQEIQNGHQVEQPDNWLRYTYPWEIERPDLQVQVNFGGKVDTYYDNDRQLRYRWSPQETITGVPYDYPVVGYHNNTVNTMRLWSARANEDFNLEFFNNGEYVRSYEQKIRSENISKVLYPNDNLEIGKELRFKQQYFFVACSLSDIVRRHRVNNADFTNFAEKAALHLNDTHPAIGIAELMRILIDDEGMEWENAWTVTQATFGYTNHTLMPEALERWPLQLFERLLPRHLGIIYEINARLLAAVESKWPGDNDRLARMSLIEEGHEPHVRMAYLAVVGSHAINGVAALHSRLLTETLFSDFYGLWPERFNNKTNGITPRRWLLACNPRLSSLITERLGSKEWVTQLDELSGLMAHVDDPVFRQSISDIKLQNKIALAECIRKVTGVIVDTDSLFDVQIKRLHEYKRQLMNVMHIMHRYLQLKRNPQTDYVPRTFIFGAKAAPGYVMAKNIIKLINNVADMVNSDPAVNKKLRVAFIPDYSVTLAEQIIPAADLSEQISTAGLEASGTGNMKLALNGAVTIGTLDGANVEIREAVGEDNFVLFGETVDGIAALRDRGYNPWDYYNSNQSIRDVIDLLDSDVLERGESNVFLPIRDSLLAEGDRFYVLADFQAYVDAQLRVDELYRDQDKWVRMCIANIANSGIFSSDRTIGEYATEIWNTPPVHVTLPDHVD